MNEWYALMRDKEDTDHSNGTYDYDKAVRMLRDMVADGYQDAYIAVIDPREDFCLGMICIDEDGDAVYQR